MVPRKVSSYMLLTGIPIDAEDALRSGLVSRLSEDDEALGKEIDTICEAISSKPKKVIELGKAFYRRQIEMGKSHGLSFMSVMVLVFTTKISGLSDALSAGGKVMVENLRYADAQEGLAAFKEKRKPNWTHTDERAH